MATLASLVVELRAETAAFRRDMQLANASRASFEQGMTRMAGTVTKAFGAFVSVQAATRSLSAIVRATTDAEQSQARLAAVLKATGNSAGLTGTRLNELAETMERTTLLDDADIRNAMAALATFRTVSGDVFERTIALAGDLSSVFGGDLSSSAVQLGKALEDPIDGISALRRVGVSFSASQKDVIKQLVETNRLAEAQRLILDTLATQVGGTAAALAGNGSLSAALDTARDEWEQFKESLGQSPELTSAASLLGRLLAQVNAIRGLSRNPGEVALFDAEAKSRQLEDHLRANGASSSLIRELQRRAGASLDNSGLSGSAREYVESLRKVSALNEKLMAQTRERAEEEKRLAAAAAEEAAAVGAAAAAEAARAAGMDAAKRAAKERRNAIESVLSALEDERAQLMMSADDIQLTTLVANGATEAQLGFAQALQRSNRELVTQRQAAEEYNDSLARFADAVAAGDRALSEGFAKELEEHNRLANESAGVFEIAWTRAIENAQDGVSGLFEDLLTGGIENFRDFAQQLLMVWANTMAQMAAAQATAGIFTAVGSALFAAGGGGLTGLYHGGGVVGTDAPSGSRLMPASLFQGAPRFHSGMLARDEFPAILQRGESVLTPAQMKAMGNSGPRTVVRVAQTIPITVQAIDRRDVAEFFDENLGRIQAAVARGIRDSRGFARHVRGQ